MFRPHPTFEKKFWINKTFYTYASASSTFTDDDGRKEGNGVEEY
jgi:hypothetical protein